MLPLLLAALGAATPSAVACVTVVRPVARGAALVTADLGPGVPCPTTARADGLYYDGARRSLRAAYDFGAGDLVGPLAGLPLADVREGEPLFLRARAGAIIVERAVSALQAGKEGRRIFVRTSDGAVVAATIWDLQR